MQKAFIEALLGEAKGNYKKAMAIAGYSENVKVSELIKSLRKEIYDAAMDALALHAPQAVFEMIGVMDDPNQAGSVVKMKAAQEVLNRAGIQQKSEDVKLNVPTGGLVILPAKRTSEGDSE